MSAFTELSQCLWRQRRLLELLLFKLDVQQLLLAAGRQRWISAAAKEVEHVLAEIRRGELDRAVLVASVATDLGLDDEPTLSALAALAPEPWDHILREHQQAFLAMTAEVEELSKTNRELIHRGMQSARELLAGLTGATPVEGYSARGSAERAVRATQLIDRAF